MVRVSIHDLDIPVRVYLPAGKPPAPVVLFSHGLGGSREGSAYLGRHWAARGYAAVFLQHPGSDDSVWRGVPAVLDQLERWNRAPGHPLRGILSLGKVGMSGHSFGAVTTQAVSGQSFPGQGKRFTDRRIAAAITFSPSSPRRGGAGEAFGAVSIPWLLMTGTKDIAVIGDADLASRLNVYPNLPAGGKYELVLHGAEHSAFSDRALPGDREARNPNHHRAILALSTAFWDAWIRGDQAAREWLDGAGARSVLEAQDRWQRK